MDIPTDANMLLSIINMKLRDGGYADFDALCRAEDLDGDEIRGRLADAGFEYIAPPVNQFR